MHHAVSDESASVSDASRKRPRDQYMGSAGSSPDGVVEGVDMPDIATMLSGNSNSGNFGGIMGKRSCIGPTDVTSCNSSVQNISGSDTPDSRRGLSQQCRPAPQFTWIMESGRNESPSHSSVRHSQGILTPQQLPIHFQHLLAASSLLWNPYDGRTASYPLGYATSGPYLGFPIPPPPTYSGKKCNNCGATSTPSWRRCPAGKNLLCNACGLYQKLHNRPRPFRVSDDGTIRVQRAANARDPNLEDANASEDNATKICSNCGTADTPLWRKVDRAQCCNACALFHKTHGFHRPIGPAAIRTVDSTQDSFSDAA